MGRFIAIFVFVIGSINAQVPIARFDYQGMPGDVWEDSIQVFPDDIYRVEFCTESVPDSLYLDTLRFYIGSNLSTDLSNHEYHGYAEFTFDSTLIVNFTDESVLPDDLYCDSKAGGVMRLYYRVPYGMCRLKFRIVGNMFSTTVYQMAIDRMYRNNSPKVINIPFCRWRAEFDSMVNCQLYHIIPEDSSIYTKIDIKRPSCANLSDGSIIFERYPEMNQFDLPQGQYKIKISNSVCSREYDINLKSILCSYYIPNVFSPNDDGLNDRFIFFAESILPYRLRIYDRWGSMIHDSVYMTNWSGWDGFDFSIGVYTYLIDCNDNTYIGDVTLIK